MRTLASLFAIALPAAARLLAQGTDAVRGADLPCYHAQPKPACSVFFLTNAGVYTGSPSLRGVADWGVMVNVGQRDAVGASFFAILDRDGATAGPTLRYRRWLGPQGSLDVAVGTPVTNNNNIVAGSLYGLVKWNPVHWLGVAARPELIRRAVFTCGPSSCTAATRSRAQLSFGVEVGWVPGLVTTASGGLALLALIAAFAGAD